MSLLGFGGTRIAMSLLLGSLVAMGCASLPPEGEEPEEAEVVLTGSLTRAQLEEALPEWVEAQMVVSFDPQSTAGLAGVQSGARLRVYLGSWCSDSRREISHLWRIVDENMDMLPFGIEYYGVDRETLRSDEKVEGFDLEFVPTIIVERDDKEVGRIVESSPNGIDRDLLGLLTGELQGVVSGRPELSSNEVEAVPDGS